MRLLVIVVTAVPTFDWLSLITIILPTIIIIVLDAVIVALAYLLKSEREHLREIERQLSEKNIMCIRI
jgi:hypothetical protein